MRLIRGPVVKSIAVVYLALTLLSLPSSSRSGAGGLIHLGPNTSVQNIHDPFDYFSNSWALIGLKDYPDATRISPDGRFLLGNDSSCRLLIGSHLVPLNSRVKKTLLRGYLPILRYEFIVNGSVEFDIETFSCPMIPSAGEAYDWPLTPNFLNMARVRMRNLENSPEKTAFGWEWNGHSDLSIREPQGLNRKDLFAGDQLIAVLSSPSDIEVTAAEKLIRMEAALSAGETQSVCLFFPFYAIDDPREADILEMTSTAFDDRKDRTASFWENLLSRGASLEIPEEKPLASYLASLIYQFIGRDEGKLWDGEGNNDKVLLRDGTLQAVSLAQAGHLEEAGRSLELFMSLQTENGRFLGQGENLDAHGYAVWAFVEYARLSGDREWLARNYSRIEKAVDFIRQSRRSESDPASPFAGILPRAPAAGENLEAGLNHIVGHDFWNLRAVQAAAAAARMLGKYEDASSFENEFEDYRAAILRAIDRTGLPFIPPSYEKDGTHWGNLDAVFPTVLLDPYDRRMTGTLENVHRYFGRGASERPGFIEGIMQWAPGTRILQPHMSLSVTNSHIIREEQEEAIDGFYSFLLHSTSTHSFPDSVQYQTKEAQGDHLPHLKAAALYVTTLRNMLVREEGENLHIFSAVPSAWLEPGKTIRFENVPTRFGRISVSATAEEDLIMINLTRPDRRDPERVLIHLPPNLGITEVGTCGNGSSLKMAMARDIFIPGMNLLEQNPLKICIKRRPETGFPSFAVKVAQYRSGSD